MANLLHIPLMEIVHLIPPYHFIIVIIIFVIVLARPDVQIAGRFQRRALMISRGRRRGRFVLIGALLLQHRIRLRRRGLDVDLRRNRALTHALVIRAHRRRVR